MSRTSGSDVTFGSLCILTSCEGVHELLYRKNLWTISIHLCIRFSLTIWEAYLVDHVSRKTDSSVMDFSAQLKSIALSYFDTRFIRLPSRSVVTRPWMSAHINTWSSSSARKSDPFILFSFSYKISKRASPLPTIMSRCKSFVVDLSLREN